MSECVVMMNMPKGCGSCPIANFGYCSINHKQVGDPFMGYPENRPASCPILFQLPEGHGRLIDADKLKAKKYHSNITNENAVAVAEIDWAETIVPAERSET